MKANETRVDKFLASNETTFAIPVYQRNYNWTKIQCQQLFKDIVAVGSDDRQRAHFIGSIVYVHDDVFTASGLTALTIIDGQQRLTTLTGWGIPEVIARAETVAARFLEVWPAPTVNIEPDTSADEVNIFDAEEPKFKKLEYAVFFGRKLFLPQVAKLYAEVFRQLIDLQPDAFHGTKLGERIQLTDDESALRQALQVSDRYFVEGNIDNTLKFDRIKLALTELGIEDELSIKYS